MNNKFSFFILLMSLALSSATFAPKFSYRTHGNVANYFESEEDMRSFFNFRKGDVVAEIGAGNGNNMVGFNQIADSITLYVEDIDSGALSKKNFDKLVRQCKKSKSPSESSFRRCIGTVTQSNLPDNSFDKIVLVSTFHEFTSMTEMTNDIYKKLKSGGQLYILEANCLSHKNITLNETILFLQKYNFTLLNKDERCLNKSTGMYRAVFKK